MKIKAFFLVAALSLSIGAIPAYAAIPSYQLSQNGSTALLSVSGTDTNAPVVLYYYPSGSATVASVGTIGTTNSAGYFSTNVTSSTYSIPSGANTYVTVNGQSSAILAWPYFTGGTQNSVYLSQASLSMNIGQNSSVTVSGGNGSYYISSNSNSSVANPTISGSSVNVYAQNSGSTTIVICSNGSTAGTSCANLFVTVNGNNNGNSTLALSQTNVTLTTGQVTLVSTTGTSASNLFVSSNSNSGVVTATASGNAVYLTGYAPGYAAVTICNSTGYTSCGTVYVTVTGTNSGSQYVTLGQTSVALTVGQTNAVSIYGSGNYYVSSNSNPSVVSASVNGSTVTLAAINPGSSTITICSNQYGSTGTCATLYATVNQNYNNNYNGNNYYGATYGQTYPTYYQQPVYPRLSGAVYLSQVPYTGAEDTIRVFAFVCLLVGWSSLAAYFIAVRKAKIA